MLKESPRNPRRKEGSTDLQEDFLNTKDLITLCIRTLFFSLGLILAGVHHEENNALFSISYLLFATLSIRI